MTHYQDVQDRMGSPVHEKENIKTESKDMEVSKEAVWLTAWLYRCY